MFVQGSGTVLVLVNKQANGNCNSVMGQSFYSPICHHLDLHTVTFHISHNLHEMQNQPTKIQFVALFSVNPLCVLGHSFNPAQEWKSQ